MNGTRSRAGTQLEIKDPVLFEYPTDPASIEPGRNIITFYKHDQRQLQSPKFFNDTIISFFLQYYLDTQVTPELKKKIYIFDCFFIKKIKSIKETKNASDSSKIPSYNCASKWLRGARIFDKDFLIMPICEKDHWVLIIISYPANIATPGSNKIPDEELHEPAVIVLNSCHGLAPAIKKTLNQFLQYQWQKERKTTRHFSIHNAKSHGIRLLYPELPQQKNSYDCGVYMLQYFYCFLKDPRRAYIRMFRRHNLRNWFTENKVDISWARRRMTNLIKEQILSWQNSNSSRKDQLDRHAKQIHLEMTKDIQSEKSSIRYIEGDDVLNENSVIVIN